MNLIFGLLIVVLAVVMFRANFRGVFLPSKSPSMGVMIIAISFFGLGLINILSFFK